MICDDTVWCGIIRYYGDDNVEGGVVVSWVFVGVVVVYNSVHIIFGPIYYFVRSILTLLYSS